MRTRTTILFASVLFGCMTPALAETEFEEFRRIAGEISSLILRMNHNLVSDSKLPDDGLEWKTTGSDAELCADMRRSEIIIHRKRELLAKNVLAHKEEWVVGLANAQIGLEAGTLTMFRGAFRKRFTRCGEPA